MRVRLSIGPMQGTTPTIKAVFETLILPALNHHPLRKTKDRQYIQLPDELKAALAELWQTNSAVEITSMGDALIIAIGQDAPTDAIGQLLMVARVFAAHDMIVRAV